MGRATVDAIGGGRWPLAVVFDLDGTLADSFPAIARALDSALRDHGLRERGLAWAQLHVGRGSAALVRDAVGEGAGDEAASAVERSYAAHYREIYLDGTPPLPGGPEVLRFIAEGASGRVGVVSNKAGALCRAWLEHWDMMRFVKVVSGPDTSGWRKPDARAVTPVLETLVVSPGQALLVGDMSIDVATAQSVGMQVVVVRSPASDEDALRRLGAAIAVDRLPDLPAWIVREGRGWR
jgi:phosphoglycolate phosphatase